MEDAPRVTRILVTGGTGAVGSYLVPELRSRGYETWVLDRGHHEAKDYIRCDVGEYRQLEAAIERAEPNLVYHLAAEFGRWNGEAFYETLWRSNVVGNKHLIRLQERHGFQVVFFSSSEVYGDWDQVMAEDVMDRFEVRQLNDYAISKWVGELQHLNAAAMSGTETVRVRLFNTYGPGERYSPYRSALCIFAYRALHGEPFVVHRGHLRSWTYVEDTARTLANIAGNFLPGAVYNVAGLEEHSMEDVAKVVLSATGADASLADYRESEAFTTRVKHVDVSRAVEDLHHAPSVSLEEGVARTVGWMRSFYGVGAE